jgi:hydrogenase nickel incorporation protein HypA/HybF
VHELAIAETIVLKLQQRMRDGGYKRINAVGMRIGTLSDVVPDALTFGFDLCIKDTALDGAALEIEHVPVRGRCNACRKEFEVDGYLFVCSECQSRDIEMLQGQELEITYLRVEDDDD